jgi:SAM-dependent methyltransferase
MNLQRTLKNFRRQLYGLRAFVPGGQRRHKLEAMVGPLGFWDQLQRYQLQAVTHLGLRPHHFLLDIGCGPLQGGIAFIRYLQPGRYVGVDTNPVAIETGREEISRHGLTGKIPRLLVSRSFGDDQLADSTFDFIWMSQVLYYFDERTMHQLFEMVHHRLRHTGIMAGDILGPASDRGFLRPPLPPVHTPESLDALAQDHGLQVVAQGTLYAFGYPKRLGLGNNILLKINHRSRAASCSVSPIFPRI